MRKLFEEHGSFRLEALLANAHQSSGYPTFASTGLQSAIKFGDQLA